MLRTKQALVEKAASAEFDARFIMSAGTPDRVKDTIEPAAYDSATRIDKLIALFNHDADKPVGYWTNIKRDGDTLTGYIKLASTNLGKMLKQLLDDGVPIGASIGFRGKGERNKAGGIHFNEIELLETSLVSTPAHPRAMQIAKAYGIELTPVQGEIEPSVMSDASALSIDRAKAAVLAANRTIRMKS
jgi:HK97 family phage prohead protease